MRCTTLTAARIWGIIAELAGWSLVTSADKGYTRAGDHVRVPYTGTNKPAWQKEADRAPARLRGPGERADAQLRSWRILAGDPHAKPVVSAGWGQILHLLLGDVEPDSFGGPGHGADRDGDLLAPPQMALLEQHVGHVMIARVDEEPLDLADLAVHGMDVVTGTDLCFTHGDDVLDGDPCQVRYARGGAARRGGDPRAAAFHHLFLLGGIEFVELGDGAAQPDFARRGADQVQRDQAAGLVAVLVLYDQVRHGAGGRVDDDAAHLAARAIRAACPGPDRELCLRCHGCVPLPVCGLDVACRRA